MRRIAATFVVVTVLAAIAVSYRPPPGYAAGAVAPRCTSAVGPATIIADVPWPQQRYDLSALSQITDGSGVTVAVVDSGVDARHPQLAPAVQTGDDLLDHTGDGRLDCVGHGTAVASIIAARPVAGSGLRGLAPGARIRPVKVSERVESDGVPSGDGNIAELVAGIRAAVAARPAVINLSISTTVDNAALRSAVQAALDADVVVVAAAGNQHEKGDPPTYPASYDGVVGVGAIGPDGTRLASSQTGSYVDIVAPGDRVVAAVPGQGHATFEGTSFAAPFVSATAALIRARWPHLNQAQVVRRLLATADPAAGGRPSPDYGYGVLNPLRALTEVLTPVPADGPAAPVLVPGPDVATATSTPTTGRAVATAAIMLLAAMAVAGVAVAIPMGRRRRWRPGRVDTSS